jgi:hypothetical protein
MFFLQPHATVGEAVRIIAETAKTLDSADLENWIEWIP